MKPVHFAYLGLGAALLVLAGCESPESKIKAACMKGGFSAGGQAQQPQQDAAALKTYCDCFTRNVKQSMTPAELKTFADKVSSNAPGSGDVTKMDQAIGGKAMQAMKTCAMS